MEELKQLMLEWTKLDSELKELNKKCAKVRQNKDVIHKLLLETIQTNELQDNIFSIPSLKTNVVYKEQTNYESMSYKFLEDKFNEYFDTQDECLQVLQFLKDNRKKNKSFVLKSEEITDGEEDEA